jgi:glycosyltransferase involved in cell wall biosynthesis
MISYQRPECLQRSVASYLETVSVPFTLVVVDNGSSKATTNFLHGSSLEVVYLKRNMYPGYACNRGWELAPADADFLHRADNDFIYRDGWCDEVAERFSENENLGQLGLLTDEEEAFAPSNVGGNNVIRRTAWDEGLRYVEIPWPEMPAGWSEDSYLTPEVVQRGYEWGRVRRSCIMGISTPDPEDYYYQRSYRDRHISDILRRIR